APVRTLTIACDAWILRLEHIDDGICLLVARVTAPPADADLAADLAGAGYGVRRALCPAAPGHAPGKQKRRRSDRNSSSDAAFDDHRHSFRLSCFDEVTPCDVTSVPSLQCPR